MSRQLTIAALQTHHDWNQAETVHRVLDLAHRAADQGARVVLPSELFEAPYFCKTRNPVYRELARPIADHPTIALFQKFAREREVVVPVSIYERAGDELYNSAAIVDADGSILGIYRKSHIPQFPGYEENAFFAPSREGAKVWETRYLKLGVGICWDQWFPELARMMALKGAELLVYPTAIGSEIAPMAWDSRDQWQTVMRGHAAANQIPVMAANRVGLETDDGVSLSFYGSSFICDHLGAMRAEGSRDREEIVAATIDLAAGAAAREFWGTYVTRRPDIYAPLTTTPAGPPPQSRADALSR
ncbi:MAG: N-carbamoylputrescine amidase [Rhodospirillaceae bacterium]|nr:N-carbamoylputrescine amidase [Rhodospirillaceae bacterium]